MKIEFNDKDVQSVLNRLGIKYVEKNNSYKSLCPNPSHNDTNIGSFSISKYGLYNCYACGFKGNLIQFVRELTGKKFNESLEFIGKSQEEYLLQLAKIDLDYKNIHKNEYKIKKVSKSFIPDNELINISQEFIDNNKYLSSRGYTTKFCQDYGIKYCISKTRYNEKYYGYIIIPIREIDSFEARDVLRNTDRPRMLYPYGVNPNSTIFDLSNLDRDKDLYFSEGVSTLAKLHSIGIKNKTAVFGKEISIKQLDILNSFKGKKILIVDQDDAGLNLVHDLQPILKNFYVMDIPVSDDSSLFLDYFKEENCKKSIEFLAEKYELFS